MSNEKKLNCFISLLNKNIGFSFDINNFNDKLKLQKYVFLAKYFGFEHDYNYSLYIRGPYSSDLADDYYNIHRGEFGYDDSLKMDMDSFSSLIKGKDILWLESATTMLSLYNRYNSNYKKENSIDSERLIKETKNIKHKIDINIIKRVFRDLNNYYLFN